MCFLGQPRMFGTGAMLKEISNIPTALRNIHTPQNSSTAFQYNHPTVTPLTTCWHFGDFLCALYSAWKSGQSSALKYCHFKLSYPVFTTWSDHCLFTRMFLTFRCWSEWLQSMWDALVARPTVLRTIWQYLYAECKIDTRWPYFSCRKGWLPLWNCVSGSWGFSWFHWNC